MIELADRLSIVPDDFWSDDQILGLNRDKRDMIEALQKKRAEHHEAGARVNDQLTQLQKGDRRL